MVIKLLNKMTYKSVEEYNNYLVDNQIQIDIINYVKEVNKINFNIDLSFINEFLELINKNKCCIHHNMLKKYGVIKDGNTSSIIKRLLEQYEMKEHQDFELYNVVQPNINGRGVIKSNEYYLHPRAFKKCLMRSLKTQKYADYYLLLEECIKYYNDYQIILQQKYIIKLKDKNKENKIIIQQQFDTIKIKDDKIDELKEMLKQSDLRAEERMKEAEKRAEEHMKKMQKQAEERDKKAARRAKKLENKLDDTNIKLDVTNEELTETLLKK
jgi:ElaB/YqjD/DUF883 family membrane-anchored ribosome-binding protein